MRKRNALSRRGGVPLMNNMAAICRECELSQKVQQLEAENAELKAINKEMEYRLSEMAIEVVALTEENRLLRLRVEEESK